MQEHHRKQFQQQNRFLLRLLNPKATPDNSPSERQCLELRWSRARSARRSSLGRGDRIVVVVEVDPGYSERTTVGAGGERCGVYAHVDADPRSGFMGSSRARSGSGFMGSSRRPCLHMFHLVFSCAFGRETALPHFYPPSPRRLGISLMEGDCGEQGEDGRGGTFHRWSAGATMVGEAMEDP